MCGLYKLTFIFTLHSPAPKRPQYNGLELLLSVCLRQAQRGWGEEQRPALFCAEARLTGGKRAIGPREDDQVSR